ncbi:MAG TPA: 4-oxalocrotonate tautomerase DmpI [Armatimonadota bacterium]|jgi:4-oxalocrotonate tautomerase
MPTVTLAARPMAAEKKREFARKVTQLVCETCGVPAEAITVFIHEYPPENISVGGTLICDRGVTPPSEG